jgi:hypothetical protein
MLVYHPAFDLYNCIFRLLQLLSYSKEDEIHIDKLRIWDFYLTFPNLVREMSFPSDLIHLKEEVFKDKINPYEEITDQKQIFERMKMYQISAIKCLASYGFVDSNLISKNIIKKTGKEIPEALLKKLNDLGNQKGNVIKLLTSDLVSLPFFGEKGLKARTGLLEFKYDPR